MAKFLENGPNELEAEIINQNLCCGCGACENICPYIDVIRSRSVFIANCDQEVGDCYKLCPMTLVDIPELEKLVFGEEREDPVLGYFKYIKRGRATEQAISEESQYGGVVSALVKYLLDQNEADGFILTGRGLKWRPKPALVENSDEVVEFTKSKYTASPAISKFNEIKDEDKRIGLVGTPCQITAARKMESYGDYNFGPLIGLFCTWGLKEDFLDYLEAIVDPEKVDKFDIPPPPAEKMLIHSNGQVKEIPLEEVREFMMPTCNSCMDMTSEFADISVGQVEGRSGWNTVTVRSNYGEKILDNVEKEGIIELKELDEKRLEHLREASGERKRRVLSEMEEDEIKTKMKDEDKETIMEAEI